MQNCPLEVAREFVGQLARQRDWRAIRSLARACRYFRAPAQAALFGTVHLESRAQCERLLGVLSAHPALAAHVRAVSFFNTLWSPAPASAVCVWLALRCPAGRTLAAYLEDARALRFSRVRLCDTGAGWGAPGGVADTIAGVFAQFVSVGVLVVDLVDCDVGELNCLLCCLRPALRHLEFSSGRLRRGDAWRPDSSGQRSLALSLPELQLSTLTIMYQTHLAMYLLRSGISDAVHTLHLTLNDEPELAQAAALFKQGLRALGHLHIVTKMHILSNACPLTLAHQHELKHLHVNFGPHRGAQILAPLLRTLPAYSRIESVRIGDVWHARVDEWRLALSVLDAELARPQFRALRRLNIVQYYPAGEEAAEMRWAMSWATERGILFVEARADTDLRQDNYRPHDPLAAW